MHKVRSMFYHYAIATVLGSGYLPKAPGTWGSFVAIPLFYLLPYSTFCAAIPVLFVLGWYSTYQILRVQSQDTPTIDLDPSYIVIDELYAMMIVLAFSHGTWFDILLSFMLFRVYDILKPWPIRYADTQLKKYALPWAALGVMIDDALAALMSCVTLQLIHRTHLLRIPFLDF